MREIIGTFPEHFVRFEYENFDTEFLLREKFSTKHVFISDQQSDRKAVKIE